MKLILALNALFISSIPLFSQPVAQFTSSKSQATSEGECYTSIFVESPIADTYAAKDKDTLTFGHETVMRLRGLPEKKSMVSLLSYEVHHLDPVYVKDAYLKIYTVSKDKGSNISLSGVDKRVDESKTNWSNQPVVKHPIGSQPLKDEPFQKFEVTDFVKSHLQEGFIDFQLQTDGKKVIDIASRESGLSAELIIEMCTPTKFEISKPAEYLTAEGWGLSVLPGSLEGKFIIEIIGIPVGGFADLMLMTETGEVIRQYPVAIQNAELSYHSLDLGSLIPGTYWAVLRKGRAMVKDQFRLKPLQGSTGTVVHLEDPAPLKTKQGSH